MITAEQLGKIAAVSAWHPELHPAPAPDVVGGPNQLGQAYAHPMESIKNLFHPKEPGGTSTSQTGQSDVSKWSPETKLQARHPELFQNEPAADNNPLMDEWGKVKQFLPNADTFKNMHLPEQGLGGQLQHAGTDFMNFAKQIPKEYWMGGLGAAGLMMLYHKWKNSNQQQQPMGYPGMGYPGMMGNQPRRIVEY